MFMVHLNMNPVFTVYNVFHKRKHKGEFILLRQLLLFFLRLKSLTLKLIPLI